MIKFPEVGIVTGCTGEYSLPYCKHSEIQVWKGGGGADEREVVGKSLL